MQRTVIAVAALAMMLLTARLGWWQLDRAAQKQALQATVDQRAGAEPLRSAAMLPATPAEVDAQLHRAAALDGRWLPSHTVWLDNRQMNGRPGFFVLTPLLLDDGSAVLVQRGWQPRNFQDRNVVTPVPTPEGNINVTGRMAPAPARLYEFEGAASGVIRQNLDFATYAAETRLRLRPFTLLQTSASADGLQRDWPAPSTGVAKHHGYAFQWFGLSALTVILYVWFQLVQPRRQRNARHSP
jgi:surfeit locus 1 family protein